MIGLDNACKGPRHYLNRWWLSINHSPKQTAMNNLSEPPIFIDEITVIINRIHRDCTVSQGGGGGGWVDVSCALQYLLVIHVVLTKSFNLWTSWSLNIILSPRAAVAMQRSAAGCYATIPARGSVMATQNNAQLREPHAATTRYVNLWLTNPKLGGRKIGRAVWDTPCNG